MDALQFNGNDPGAVMLGNFINYYDFHPPEERLQLLPKNLCTPSQGKQYVCLDIGCNTGDLTTKVYEKISDAPDAEDLVPSDNRSPCIMIGIDIDPVLIERAQEKNKHKGSVIFRCTDFMNHNERLLLLQECPLEENRLFDVIFCFSVTMWIHLNHGDEGLCKFLTDISEMGKMLVLEPQPWKCYKSAVKRMKRCQKSFPLFQQIKIRENVEWFIENFLQDNCHFVKVHESAESKWGRKVVFYRRKNDTEKM